jgi:hypothetical protein
MYNPKPQMKSALTIKNNKKTPNSNNTYKSQYHYDDDFNKNKQTTDPFLIKGSEMHL